MRVLWLTVVLVSAAGAADAQPRGYVGAAVAGASQRSSTGGAEQKVTTVAWSLSAGLQVTPRLSVAVEPVFIGEFSRGYSYFAGPSRQVRVVSSRRDALITLLWRYAAGAFEPVAGFGYLRGRVRRDATNIPGGTAYFSDSRTDGAMALVGGMDVAIPITSRVRIVPTFRVSRRVTDPSDSSTDPSTLPGRVFFLYGVGVRASY